MNVYGSIFYVIAFLTVAFTLFAIAARQPIRSIVYLICSFFGTALLFYLLGAPLLAAFEVIIYAGAIMVLFLFIIMTLNITTPAAQPTSLRWPLYSALVVVLFSLAAFLTYKTPAAMVHLIAAIATPQEFGRFLFQQYWLPVEIVSLLLLIALVGALYLGRNHDTEHTVSSTRDT